MRLDIFNHFFPKRFFDKMLQTAGDSFLDMGKRDQNVPMLINLDMRLRMIEKFGPDYRQVLSLGMPPIETFATPAQAKELARIANDEMAEIVEKHPDRFPTFAAALPLNDVEASIDEAKRAFDQLGARCVQFFTNVNGLPLDDSRFRSLFKLMTQYDLPILLHPARAANQPDYLTEERSRYEIWWTFGWPYETSSALARLVFSKIMDELPTLKIVTHHCGGLIPYLAGRVGPGCDQLGARTSEEDYAALRKSLKKRSFDYFKNDFFADTALFGAKPATECGLKFYGADKLLFASDSPFDPEGGSMYIRETMEIINSLEISNEDREKIYYKNALKLMKLN
jgi:predicted TIM-barrel fold metal-dependent hydrolase